LKYTQTIVSSQPRLEIQGQAPFKQSGVYEAQIAITDSKPSDDDIRSKKFSSLWRGNFHLRVKEGLFSETLGSPTNPLPPSIENLDKVWIIVTDLFSSLHTVFDVPLSRSTSKTETKTDSVEKQTIPDTPKPKRTTKTNVVGSPGPTGAPGDKGSPGPTGAPGDKGPIGPPGQQGPIGIKGQEGPKGPTGDKGATGDKGSQGDKGISGDKGLTGDKGITGDKGDKGDKGITGPPGRCHWIKRSTW
jgi:integrin beta 3/collagen type V/XI/XXIV/XXVII alpha